MVDRLQLLRHVGFIVGMLCSIVFFSQIVLLLDTKKSPMDLGLGLHTTSHVAKYNGRWISSVGHHDEYEKFDEIIASAKYFQEQGHRITLWLGASQLHAINNYEEGDHLAVCYANQISESNKSDMVYVQMSFPNASNYDLLAMYLRVIDAGIVPDNLLVSVVYDDLREKMKPYFLKHLPPVEYEAEVMKDEGINILLAEKRRYDDENGVLGRLDSQVGEASANGENERGKDISSATNPIGIRPQEELESWLTENLESIWPPYEDRKNLYANLKYTFRALDFKLRFMVSGFRLNAVADGDRIWNEKALISLVKITKSDGVRLLFYKQPHRPGEEKFYHIREKYDAFFAYLKKLSAENGAGFEDLELLVPAEHYGLTSDGLPDVFHFRDYGHRKLGEAVERFVRRTDVL